jgi:hypothetical protein
VILITVAVLWEKKDYMALCLPLPFDAYGYTFVGKGTEYTSNYEARIYQALEALQGYAVPVYLGNIYLRQNIYYLPTRAIVHIKV